MLNYVLLGTICKSFFKNSTVNQLPNFLSRAQATLQDIKVAFIHSSDADDMKEVGLYFHASLLIDTFIHFFDVT